MSTNALIRVAVAGDDDLRLICWIGSNGVAVAISDLEGDLDEDIILDAARLRDWCHRVIVALGDRA